MAEAQTMVWRNGADVGANRSGCVWTVVVLYGGTNTITITCGLGPQVDPDATLEAGVPPAGTLFIVR